MLLCFVNSLHIHFPTFTSLSYWLQTIFFYTPYAIFFVVTFVLCVIVMSLRFVTLFPSDLQNSPTDVIYNWPVNLQVTSGSCAIIYQVFEWTWLLAMALSLVFNNRYLTAMPPTFLHRYLIITYSFVTVQMALVIVYFATIYFFVIYFVIANYPFSSTDNIYAVLSDRISMMYSVQSQLLGRTLLLSVYGLTLAIMFLPVKMFDDDRFSGYRARQQQQRRS